MPSKIRTPSRSLAQAEPMTTRATKQATIVSRRAVLVGGAAFATAGCAGGLAEVETLDGAPIAFADLAPPARKTAPDWRRHFSDVEQGAILVNIAHRSLTYWAPGGASFREFPIAVPLNADLQRTGETRIVRRRENPDWRPTPSMLERNPDLPLYIGPGPMNPLGERALYLGWTYYAIHGTNNPLSIGSRATSGCFRMHPDDILWLYDRAQIGTPVTVVERLDV